MRISDWSSDVCSSDLHADILRRGEGHRLAVGERIEEELLVDRRGETAALRMAAHVARLVEAEIETRVDVGGAAVDPHVLRSRRRSCFADNRDYEVATSLPGVLLYAASDHVSVTGLAQCWVSTVCDVFNM